MVVSGVPSHPLLDKNFMLAGPIKYKDLMKLSEEDKPIELVNSPKHYKSNGMEVIDVVDAYELNFNLGNVIKYILRADKKGNKKIDLEKACWYLNREIDKFHG